MCTGEARQHSNQKGVSGAITYVHSASVCRNSGARNSKLLELEKNGGKRRKRAAIDGSIGALVVSSSNNSKQEK